MTIPLTKWLVWAVVAIAALGFLGALSAAQTYINDKRKAKGGNRLETIALFIGLILVGAVGRLIWVEISLSDVADWLQFQTGSLSRIVLGTGLVITLAVVLFIVKIIRLRFYAVIEILFAIFGTVHTMSKLKDVIEPVELLTIFTAVYLLIRGLDNFKKDLDERKRLSTRAAVNAA
jgi:hypothetical protein